MHLQSAWNREKTSIYYMTHIIANFQKLTLMTGFVLQGLYTNIHIYTETDFRGKGSSTLIVLPHGVKDRPVLHDSKQLVGRRHVVCAGRPCIAKERVGGPDLVHHAVVQRQDFNGPLKG